MGFVVPGVFRKDLLGTPDGLSYLTLFNLFLKRTDFMGSSETFYEEKNQDTQESTGYNDE